jgi:hypothetical protein
MPEVAEVAIELAAVLPAASEVAAPARPELMLLLEQRIPAVAEVDEVTELMEVLPEVQVLSLFVIQTYIRPHQVQQVHQLLLFRVGIEYISGLLQAQ